jgi:hypothetical protein
MKEFAFDLHLYAVARVRASTEKAARKKMQDIIDCIDIGFDQDDVKLTEASQAQDIEPLLFEIDGEPPPFPSEAHYIAAAMADGWLPHDSDTAKEYCESNDIDASKADPKDARL